MQYYSAVKMNGMPLYTTQMNLTDSMLNQSNQTQKSTQYTHTHTHTHTQRHSHFCDARYQWLLEVGAWSCWLQRGKRGLSGVVECSFLVWSTCYPDTNICLNFPIVNLESLILLNVHYASVKWFPLKSVIRKQEVVWVSLLHSISFTDKCLRPHFTFS